MYGSVASLLITVSLHPLFLLGAYVVRLDCLLVGAAWSSRHCQNAAFVHSECHLYLDSSSRGWRYVDALVLSKAEAFAGLIRVTLPQHEGYLGLVVLACHVGGSSLAR